jgi:hypothetical protein
MSVIACKEVVSTDYQVCRNLAAETP